MEKIWAGFHSGDCRSNMDPTNFSGDLRKERPNYVLTKWLTDNIVTLRPCSIASLRSFVRIQASYKTQREYTFGYRTSEFLPNMADRDHDVCNVDFVLSHSSCLFVRHAINSPCPVASNWLYLSPRLHLLWFNKRSYEPGF